MNNLLSKYYNKRKFSLRQEMYVGSIISITYGLLWESMEQ